VKGYLLVEEGGTRYGLRLEDVREVFDLESVHPAPRSHPSVVGLVRVRGRLMPLVHLGALLEGVEAPEGHGATGVVTRCGDQNVVLAVHDADTVVREAPEPAPDGWELPWAGAVARRDDVLIPVLDMDFLAERLMSVNPGGKQ
jgi:chemotaxis signal transduction protein